MAYPSNKPQLASLKVDDYLRLKNGAVVKVYKVQAEIEARLVSGSVTNKDDGRTLNVGFPMAWGFDGVKQYAEKYVEGRTLDVQCRIPKSEIT